MCTFDDTEIYRSILESLTTGLCVVDMQKKIVLWSDGAERITGYLRHEVIGHSCIGEPLLHCDQPGCEFCSEECPVAVAMKTAQPAWPPDFCTTGPDTKSRSVFALFRFTTSTDRSSAQWKLSRIFSKPPVLIAVRFASNSAIASTQSPEWRAAP